MLNRIGVLLLAVFMAPAVCLGQSEEELAKKLQNPVASLISVPLQNNFDFGIGPDDGFRYTLNVQPVIPFNLTPEWNLISRTILPIIYQNDIAADSGDQFGLGDTLQSLFFSPTRTEPFIWGVGPALLLPTGTEKLLGADKWGVGPTAVLLKQTGPWTYGMLANHIWSFAGEDDRPEVNSTFLQPFLSYTFKSGLSLVTNTESTYDWENNQWTVPVQAGVSKVLTVGRQPISLALNGRYWAEGPDTAPDWGLRLVFTLLFPK
jgi:hypothetical protein